MSQRITKSLRLPPEVYDYVDQYRGDNFTDRFCNLIADVEQEEPERRRRLEVLDKEIKEREALARRLYTEIKRIGDELSTLVSHARWGI